MTSIPQTVNNPNLLRAAIHSDVDQFLDLLVGWFQRVRRQDILTEEGKKKWYGVSIDAVGQVVRSMVAHCGWHGNWIWASEERLSDVSLYSERAVRRAVAILKSKKLITRVVGKDRLAGPGPHRSKKERRSLNHTPIWDVSGLAAILPRQFEKVRHQIEELGEFFFSALDDAFKDPFADGDEDSSSPFDLSKHKHQQASLRENSFSRANGSLPSVASVSIDEKAEKSQSVAADLKKNEPENRTVPGFFSRPTLSAFDSPVRQRENKSQPSDPLMALRMRDCVPATEKPVLALMEWGVSEPMARRIATLKGEKWVSEWTFAAHRTRKPVGGPGFFVDAARHDWDLADWADRQLDREEMYRNRSLSLAKPGFADQIRYYSPPNGDAKTVTEIENVKPAAPMPEKDEEAMSLQDLAARKVVRAGGESPLAPKSERVLPIVHIIDDLSPEYWADLEKRAIEDARQQHKIPAMRAAIERSGVSHPLVQVRLKEILRQEFPDRVIPDTAILRNIWGRPREEGGGGEDGQ